MRKVLSVFIIFFIILSSIVYLNDINIKSTSSEKILTNTKNDKNILEVLIGYKNEKKFNGVEFKEPIIDNEILNKLALIKDYEERIDKPKKFEDNINAHIVINSISTGECFEHLKFWFKDKEVIIERNEDVKDDIYYAKIKNQKGIDYLKNIMEENVIENNNLKVIIKK